MITCNDCLVEWHNCCPVCKAHENAAAIFKAPVRGKVIASGAKVHGFDRLKGSNYGTDKTEKQAKAELKDSIDKFAARESKRPLRKFEAQLIPLGWKMEVFERDGFKCKKCASEYLLTVDHIYPISKGGSDHPDNLQTLCSSCNSAKGNSVPKGLIITQNMIRPSFNDTNPVTAKPKPNIFKRAAPKDKEI